MANHGERDTTPQRHTTTTANVTRGPARPHGASRS